MKRWIWMLLLLGAIALPSARPAAACSCGQITVESEFAAADHVFEGEVIDKITLDPVSRLSNVTFKVTNSWKGSNPNPMTIELIDGTGTDCVMGLGEGQAYLLFIRGNQASACGNSHRLRLTGEPNPALDSLAGRNFAPRAIIVVGSFLGLLAAMYWRRKRATPPGI